VAGEQSLDAPAGSSRLCWSGGGHEKTPLEARLVSSAVLLSATNVAIIACQAHPPNELLIAGFFANFSKLRHGKVAEFPFYEVRCISVLSASKKKPMEKESALFTMRMLSN